MGNKVNLKYFWVRMPLLGLILAWQCYPKPVSQTVGHGHGHMQ